MGCLAHLHLSSFSLVVYLEACTQLEKQGQEGWFQLIHLGQAVE